LASIKKLSDISTYEGQAQFVGQWNADVYEYLTGGNVDMNRLKREAMIILNSGFDSISFLLSESSKSVNPLIDF
jgi:hypothetical protein